MASRNCAAAAVAFTAIANRHFRSPGAMMTNPMNLTGRNVLVTGAAQGIGLATARLLSALDANVTLVDRNETALAAVLAGFPADKTKTIAGSVTDRGSVTKMVADSAARFRCALALLNTAGTTRTPTHDTLQ